MDPTHWRSVKEALFEALEMSGDERLSYISGLDPGIREEVERLVKADSAAANFIASPFLLENSDLENVSEQIPADIDGYRVIREIGSGGMGTVYLAEHSGEGFSQKVALKLIKRGMDTNSVLKRFLLERNILANLDHPNIARMLDGGSTADGLPYFVLEFIDGSEIRKYCNENRFGLNERLDLFRKVCNAVSNAHQKLVVHRDLKPTNILVTKDGEPKLLDFGIAKLLSPDWNADTNEATLTLFRAMTPEYASPEQIAGEATTTATDVYSLGVILYELLAGQRPFDMRGKVPKELVENVLSKDPPRPSTVGSGQTSGQKERTASAEVEATEEGDAAGLQVENSVDRKLLQGDLDNIILKALRREPERRYQSVQEFVEDIRRFQHGLPVSATADSRIYRFNKYFKRHRVGVIGTALAATILITATLVTGWQYTVAQREKAAAERRFADTRALAKSVLYELYDAIDAIPGSTKAKELLATRAIEYLDRLAAEGSADPYLLTELADGYQRIGDIQGGLNRSNLGQTGEAKNSYAKARELREAVIASGASDPKFRFKLAMAYSKTAASDFNEANVKGYYANHLLALETLKALESVLPDDEDFLFELGASYANCGSAAAANGEVDAGLEFLKKAEAILTDLHNRNPSDLTRAMAVSTINDMVAEIHSSYGRKAQALSYMYRSADYLRPLLEANPDNAEVQRNLAVTYYSISKNECDLGSYDEAMLNAEKAIGIAVDLLKRDEKNFDLRLLYAMTLYSKGKILVRSGRPVAGLKILDDVLQKAKALQADDPENEITRVRTAYVDDEIGRAYLAIGLTETNRAAKLKALRTARSSLQAAYDSYKKYGNSMVGEDAQGINLVAAEIEKCDAAINALAR